MDLISAPSAAAKSSPVCVLDHIPLEAPKRPVRWYPPTGSTHGGGLASSWTPLTTRYAGTRSGSASEATAPVEAAAAVEVSGVSAESAVSTAEAAAAAAGGAAVSVVVVSNPVRSTGVRTRLS
jgi:hypothetical protein